MTSTQNINNHKLEKKQKIQPSVLATSFNSIIVKLVNGIQIALAETYINGLEINDAICLKILRSSTTILYHNFPSLMIAYDWVDQESDRLAEGSQELMDIQYNLSEQMFKLMLGESAIMYPKYSMALWETGASNMEEAQIAMVEDLIAKAEIKDGYEILDIGCGWGSAANYILQKFPSSKVTGLTLSHEQCEYLRKQIKNPQTYLNPERFTICEADFNDVEFTQRFDRIISIGAFEHFGNMSKTLAKVASFLKPEGKALIHIISTRLPNNIWSPFLQKYIFPYARIWRYDYLPSCNKHLKTTNTWYINGLNYAKTLRAWLQNFDEHQDVIQTLDFGMDYSRFRRIWRLYLLWCIAYFEAGQGNFLGNQQYLLEKI